MRVTLDKLMEQLGVGRMLSPYETQPWVHYDSEKSLTCSAEVRMGPGGEDVEAEIQFLRDEAEESGEGDSAGGETKAAGGREQVMRMRALPVTGTAEWASKELRVKGEDYVGKIYNWEEKGCNFFRACVTAIQMGEMPDIDDLIEKELADDSFGGGRRGRVGRKSPKIKPGQLLGLGKRGM